MADITIKEFAALCGVAVSTVSRAMNGHPEVSSQTRARILEMADRYNYVANSSARSLKAHSTKVIAVLIQGELSPIFIPIITLFDAAIKNTGFSLSLTFIPDDQAEPATLARLVRDRKISGVLFLGRYGDKANGAVASQRLAQMGTPMVFCTTSDFSGSATGHASVRTDDRDATRRITTHVLERGHRSLAYLATGSPGDAEQVWAQRIDGFRDAVFAWPERVAATVLESALPDRLYTMENGYESMLHALDSGFDASAVVAVCDAVAVGATKALTERGLRVPEDVSIVGFDDVDIARFVTPSLTTVRQPLEEIVAEAMRVLLATIADPSRPAESLEIPGELVVRDSVTDRRAP